MNICEYGCGLEGKYQLKNGKWCCSVSYKSCPGVRKKVSESNKGRMPWNKGIKTGSQAKEHKKKISISHMGVKKGPHSKETRKKLSEANKGKNKLTVEQIKERYPIFSKIEGMRYNPDKPNEKEIQVHCKNHNCKNSKEKGGWFTPTPGQVDQRIVAIERPKGFGESNFYCCQECKDTCVLYGLHSDPLKENNLPYTPAEWSEIRGRAWERDNRLCQDCGKSGTEVHHIKPVKLEPFLALDIDNLITLCEDCHKKYHKKDIGNSTGNLAKITCSPESQRFLNQK